MIQNHERESLVRALAIATFVVFFQAYMVGPILPFLAMAFGASLQTTGLIIPAYLIPYGIATLVHGLLADRFGPRRLIFVSLGAFVVLTALSATATGVSDLILWRVLTGVGASGIVPMGLVLVGTLFPYKERGRPLGWLFGAMAGGMAFGSSAGAVLAPFIGWRGLFLGTSAAGLLVALWVRARAGTMIGSGAGEWPRVTTLLSAYRPLLASARGSRTYACVLLNAMFHSGVFTWLGVYFDRRYHLGEVGIGLALLGYGVPGFLLGPTVGRWSDRWGRGRLLPLGLLLSAVAAASLRPEVPLMVAVVSVTVLSFGYDLTQPLLAGLVTDLGGTRPGQAMGLNVFLLFCGFGFGSLVFGELLRAGFSAALGSFALSQFVVGLAALILFRSERPSG